MDSSTRRLATLRATLGFVFVPPAEPELHLLHRWLDSWRGVGLLAVGLHRIGYDLDPLDPRRVRVGVDRAVGRAAAGVECVVACGAKRLTRTRREGWHAIVPESWPSAARLFGAMHGDRERERRALPDLTLDPDPALVQLDELPTERQT